MAAVSLIRTGGVGQETRPRRSDRFPIGSAVGVSMIRSGDLVGWSPGWYVDLSLRAIGKPRMTQRDRWARRPAVLRYRTFCDQLRLMCAGVPAAGTVSSVSVVAHFQPPKHWSKKRRAAELGGAHRQKPDADNVAKAVLDALFKDDERIPAVSVAKHWGSEDRLQIAIWTSEEMSG